MRRYRDLIIIVVAIFAISLGKTLSVCYMTKAPFEFFTWGVDFLFIAFLLGGLVTLDTGIDWIAGHFLDPKSKRFRWSAGVAKFAMIVLVGAPLSLAFLQLHPTKIRCSRTPADEEMAYEAVTIESDGLTLSAWYIPAKDPNAPIVLIAHGVGANKDNFLAAGLGVHRLGLGAFLFDFRAHGNSDGRLATLGILESHDVRAAYDWLKKRFPDRPIHALGYSMGTSAVVLAAADGAHFDKIILDSPLASIESTAEKTTLRPLGPFKGAMWQLASFWGGLIAGVNFNQNRPIDRIVELKQPILFVHGDADNIVPASESELLWEACHKKWDRYVIPGGNHCDSIGKIEYWKRVAKFFKGDKADS